MPLLDTDDLSFRFDELLKSATSVDIAVAWITSCGELDRLCAVASTKPVRVVVGLTGNATHPVALRTLRAAAAVRVGYGQPRTFHPKLYLFRSMGSTTAWIGSANLTTGGFALNCELVHEFSDDGAAQRLHSR
jgi:HKD family nuclease